MLNEELKVKFGRIQDAAQENNIVVVAAMPMSEHPVGYQVSLPLEEFVALFTRIKPRIVYLLSSTFNAREDALEALLPGFESNPETQHEMLDRQEVADLVKRFKDHEGEPDTFAAHFMVEGILHSTYEQASWREQFESEAGELHARFEEEQEDEDERNTKMGREKVREYATTLCENPKFNEGRPSREKRTYLAENLFPDLTEDEISEVVDEATNLGWLKGK